jgi:hypothetical protein
MARPWAKRSAWPYRCKSGRKSYTVGFYDHDRREHCRTFPSVRHARAWMDDYITAERRGRDSLRRFLLDLDAKEANEREGRSIGAVLELYLQVNAHPRNEGGLAPTTYEHYESIVNRHLLGRPRNRPNGGTLAPKPYAQAVAVVSAVSFNGPRAPRAWREQMLREGVSKATRGNAWRVLSAALSWAVASNLVPEIEINGCGLASEPRGNRRRSLRAGGTGYAPKARRSGPFVASWALSPQAVEAIRAQLLTRVKDQRKILARRDAMIVGLQYGLAARNQEVWALRWSSLAGEFAWILEVLSCGQLDEWGKTAHSTQRRTLMPSLLQQDLADWQAALQSAGHPTREIDFIIPGDLAGPEHGVRDPRSGACHFSKSQARAWGRALLHPSRHAGRQAPRLRPDPRREPILAAPRRDLPAPTRRRPTDRRQRVRHQPEDAQRPLRIRDRRPTPARTKTPPTSSGAPRAPRKQTATRERAQREETDHEDERHRGKLFAWLSARRSASRLTDQQPRLR